MDSGAACPQRRFGLLTRPDRNDPKFRLVDHRFLFLLVSISQKSCWRKLVSLPSKLDFFVDSFLLIRSADDEQKASALSPLRTSALPALPVAGSCMSEWLLCFLSLSPISSQELRLGSRLEFRETHSKFSFVQGRPKVPPGEELKISHAWSTSVQSTSTGAFFSQIRVFTF